jgi:hypothetical protein
LRSVLNDDCNPQSFTGGEIYSTWKARKETTTKKSKKKVSSSSNAKDASLDVEEIYIDNLDGVNSLAFDDAKTDIQEKVKDHVSKALVDAIFYSPLRINQPGIKHLLKYI